VRRAAEISLSDLESEAMRNAKSGNWYQTAKQRTMANNSSVFDFVDTVPVEVFGDEWMALIHSKSGERGIFNRQAALRYSPERRHWGEHLPGCNPCAEILLRPFQFCNLSIAIARPWDTRETLERKVRIATIFGKIQSLRTEFKYIRKEWKVNSDEERLLGVDITGHADCPLLRFDNAERAALLRHLKQVVDKTDRQLSDRFGMSLSAANTTVKPSGDSAALFNCGSGVSPRYAKFYMRWVRESKNSPIAKFLLDSGVPNAPAPEAPEELLVFGFPMRAPEGAVLRDDMTAVQQFDNWLEWKENWAEHSVSATIYADDKEWLDLGAVVYKNIDKITGLSFLPRDNGIYAYAPNEELTEERYYEIMRSFPKINWAKLGEYEKEDYTEASQTVACHGGKCD
jgi:ribonucleoside-diphosphate reductase alpha chain